MAEGHVPALRRPSLPGHPGSVRAASKYGPPADPADLRTVSQSLVV